MEVENLLNQIYALDGQIIDAQNETQEALLLVKRDDLIVQYLQKQSEYEQLAVNFSASLQQQANAQLTILNGTTANATWEQNLKLVLQYQLGMLSSGQPLSQTQNTALQAIESQCRYEGGYGVLLARKMLPAQLYGDDILCSGRNGDSAKKQANEVVIYPNPAYNFILLTSPKQTDAGTALLFDVFGQLVRNFYWSGIETRLDISDVPSGTYFLKVKAEEQPTIIKKVLIIR
jgi:Secretion system C-terminal sorting domain